MDKKDQAPKSPGETADTRPPKNPTQDHNSSRREKAEIKQEIERQEQAIDRLQEEAQVRLGTFSAPEQQELDRIINQVEATNPIDNRARQNAIATFLQEGASDKVKQVVTLVTSLYGETQQLEDLQTEYLPYKREEIIELVRNISSRLDFQAVLAYYENPNIQNRVTTDNLRNTANELFFLRQTEVAIVTGNLEAVDMHGLSHIEYTLQHYGETWTTKGFLQENAEPEYEIEKEYGETIGVEREKTKKAIDELLDQEAKYKALGVTYRPSLRFSTIVDDQLEAILTTLESKAYDRQEEFLVADLDPRYLRAVVTLTEQKQRALAARGIVGQTAEQRQHFLQNRRESVGEEIFDTIAITGLILPEGQVVLLTKDELVLELKDKLPPYFLSKIDEISFTPQKITPDPKRPDIEQLGGITPTFNNEGELASSKIEVYSEISSAASDTALAFMLKREGLIGTVIHEIGHRIHYEAPLDDLEQWEQVMKDDETPVSHYVFDSRKKDVHKGMKEDFAASFALFMSEPSLLWVLSEKRFSYMQELVADYLPEEKRQAYRGQLQERIGRVLAMYARQGLSTERVREEYLRKSVYIT